MTNLEFYKEEIAKEITTQLYSHATSTYECLVACYKKHCDVSSNPYEILDWLCEEYSILDKEEKEYLSAVIRPFRKRVISLTKASGIEIKYEELEIVVKLPDKPSKTCVRLPYFKKDTMYKGMELNKDYTLEDLGL